MKINLLFLLLLQACSPLHNKANKDIYKAYAYSRAILAGVAPSAVIHENGSLREKPAEANQQYFIYTEVAVSSDVAVKYLWLNQKRYDVISTVKPTPVIIENSISTVRHMDTLAPKTGYKVFQVEIQKESLEKSRRPKSVKSPGIILEYLSKGKTRYYPIDTIRQLAPLVLQ